MNFPMSGVDIAFYILAVLSLLFAGFVVFSKNAITSAFSLILVFFNMAGLFALNGAHFLAGLQVLVYAGAIMVLFIFVIMLLNADLNHVQLKKHPWLAALSLATVSLFAVLLIQTFLKAPAVAPMGSFSSEKIEAAGGNVQALSYLMFSDYVLPFELTSILLLVAIIGSVALAKRK